MLATGLPHLTEACLTPFAAVQYADGPFARSGAETEQASRDKWRELLLLLARPIGESHVAVEAARSERSACFNRDRTNTPTCARVQCAGCRCNQV